MKAGAVLTERLRDSALGFSGSHRALLLSAADLLDSVQEARNGYVAGVYTAEQMVDRIDNAFRGEENPL